MTTTFNTNQFRAAHGRNPNGHGMWMFRNNDTGETFTHTGNFSEAKTMCAKAWPGAHATVQS